jgi:cbb3-type cytochrome oxidase subunit 3
VKRWESFVNFVKQQMKIKLYIFFLLLSTFVFAQQKRVSTTVDSTKVKIGAQINLTLKTTVDTLSKVVFPEANLFGSMEVLESYPTDTIKENFKYQLIKKYGLTQWDSGSYVIPRLQILINDKPHFSDSIRVEIAPIIVDTLKQKMYDIKDVIAVEDGFSFWWLYVLGILALLTVAYFVYKWIQKRKKEKTEEPVYTSPLEKANAHLKNLEQQKLVERGEIKAYYSELTNIARTYIEESIEIPAMESTTDELITAFKIAVFKKKLTLNPETLDNLEKVLKQADLVKFAKSKPLEFEIAEDKIKIEKTIQKIHESIPEEIAEDDEAVENEKKAALLAKKKRKQKITLVALLSALVLFGVLVFVVISKGFDFVKDNIIGHPTKELLEGEWVKSEYGNPAVRIETPKVLKRIDASNMIPPEAKALIKEMNMFGYGSMTDQFYTLVMTANYRDSVQVDLDKVLEGNLKTWEALGAQNILVKQEVFNTPEGVQGVKAFGTLIMLDPITKKSNKLFYVTLLFKQDNGLQQVVVTKLEEDEVASEIIDRIINSIELGKAL